MKTSRLGHVNCKKGNETTLKPPERVLVEGTAGVPVAKPASCAWHIKRLEGLNLVNKESGEWLRYSCNRVLQS